MRLQIKTLFFTFAFLCFHAHVKADDVRFTGKALYASDSTAVVGATVKLLSSDGGVITGVTTNEEGSFTISGEETKVSRLELSFAGFVPIAVQIKDAKGSVALGNLYLIEDNVLLDEVTVSGSLRQFNRQLVFPDRLQMRASQDFIALLHNLSLVGLSVDQVDKNASIYGKPVQWKINGVPRTLAEVRNLKPESILRIDYTDMPSMRELDRGYGGIIDVILKERTDGGSVRTHLQSALWVGFVNGSASANYHQGKSDFSLDYNVSFRNYPKWSKDSSEKFIGAGSKISRVNEGEDSPFKMTNHDINLTYLYQPSDKSQFSATWRNSIGWQSFDMRGNILESGKSPYFRSSVSRYKGYTPALDLFYQHIFKDGSKLEANVLGTLSIGRGDRNLIDMIEGVEVASYSNPVNSKYRSIIGELSYQKLLHPKVYFSTGLQNRYAYSTNEYLSPSSYLDELRQNNTYLYAQISGRLTPKVQYSAGTGAKLFYVKNEENDRYYLRNQSSIGLYYNPTTSFSIALNSYFTPYLPSLAQLSSVRQRYDDLSVYTGNRDLKPSYAFTNRLNFNLRKGKVTNNLALHYNHTTNPFFTRVTYQPTENYFLFQSDNGNYNRQFGAEWKLNLSKLWEFFSIYTTLGYNRYESNVGGNPLHLNSLSGNISLQVSYKDWVFSGYYAKSGKTLYNETVSNPTDRAGLTAMWSKGNWTLYGQMIYIGFKDGDSLKMINYSKTNPSESYIKIPENGNMLTLGVVWNLDFGKRMNKIRRGLQNYDSNNSVVKVQN